MRSRTLRLMVVFVFCVLLLAQVGFWVTSWRRRSRAGRRLSSDPPELQESGPYEIDRFEVAIPNPETGNALPIAVWHPASGSAIDVSGAPYPGLVFAHGAFAWPSLYSGTGAQLASWGYVVAMPDFSDERLSARVSDARRVLTYLQDETKSPGSKLHATVDAARLGIVGHSLGGHTALAVAARDERVRAAVALDPGDIRSFLGFVLFDAKKEGAALAAPTLLIGAEAHRCNLYASYDRLYGSLGATHKARLIVTAGSHCDFMVTSETSVRDGCYRMCRSQYSSDRAALASRYTVAWLNYYLGGDVRVYESLYGAGPLQDIDPGRPTWDVATAPKGVEARAEPGAIVVSWERTDYGVVDGYNIYRRVDGRQYAGRPTGQVRSISSYVDTDVTPGTTFSYTVRSRDAAGNEHEPSREVSAVAEPR